MGGGRPKQLSMIKKTGSRLWMIFPTAVVNLNSSINMFWLLGDGSSPATPRETRRIEQNKYGVCMWKSTEL